MSNLISARGVPSQDAKRAQDWFKRRGITAWITHDGITTIELFADDANRLDMLAALKLALRYDVLNWQFEHTEFKVISC